MHLMGNIPLKQGWLAHLDIWHLNISHFSQSGEVIKAWTGEAHPENILYEENSWQIYGAEAVMVHSPTATAIAKSNLVNYSVDIGGIETGCTHDSRLHSKGLDNKWTGMPFTNSCSVNETSVFNTQKLDYNLVYVLSFRELDHQTDQYTEQDPQSKTSTHKGQPTTIFESEEQALQLSEIEHLDAKLAQEVGIEGVPDSEEALVEATYSMP
ncbi:hypothetical protein KIW84_071491 [Lathyrus oleraceus]|uniref:Uncharacterized protein n=1 Tax=Pisum sativum TaxID=3888 RepID=A0A9D4VIF2_PEA|nr:hypothetical protein KIW84_071491 [Pisum sativum]